MRNSVLRTIGCDFWEKWALAVLEFSGQLFELLGVLEEPPVYLGVTGASSVLFSNIGQGTAALGGEEAFFRGEVVHRPL